MSSRHIDLRETATGKPKKDKKPHEKKLIGYKDGMGVYVSDTTGSER